MSKIDKLIAFLFLAFCAYFTFVIYNVEIDVILAYIDELFFPIIFCILFIIVVVCYFLFDFFGVESLFDQRLNHMQNNLNNLSHFIEKLIPISEKVVELEKVVEIIDDKPTLVLYITSKNFLECLSKLNEDTFYLYNFQKILKIILDVSSLNNFQVYDGMKIIVMLAIDPTDTKNFSTLETVVKFNHDFGFFITLNWADISCLAKMLLESLSIMPAAEFFPALNTFFLLVLNIPPIG